MSGFVVNKFRGDDRLLAPALSMITRTSGRPVLGVLPWLPDLWSDAEDALDVTARERAVRAPVGDQVLRVAVVRFPRISNFTDVDAIAAEPGVALRFTALPAEVADADFTLLPATVRFEADKVLSRPTGEAYGVHVRTAYAIHHGRVTVERSASAPFLDGCRVGAVWGTSWHGAFEEDDFRRAFLHDVASVAGLDGFVVAPDMQFAALREQRIDRLADAVARHLDTGALRHLIDHGAPPGLPFVPPGAPA